jgi:hypothetical protein
MSESTSHETRYQLFELIPIGVETVLYRVHKTWKDELQLVTSTFRRTKLRFTSTKGQHTSRSSIFQMASGGWAMTPEEAITYFIADKHTRIERLQEEITELQADISDARTLDVAARVTE